ncbi:MAG: dihydroorotate dehydrogenase-like protein [Rikenellaceae bacterium]
MKRVETTFGGLTLENPIIVASSTLTGNLSSVTKFIDAGAGAVVLKSLFEEDIAREIEVLSSSMMHVEGGDYTAAYVESNALNGYLDLIRECKMRCGKSKIIASINCHTSGNWSKYSKAIEQAGADAMEINVMSVVCDASAADGEQERLHIEIAKSVCDEVEIPVIMKLGATITNHVSLIKRLVVCGVKGFVLFNRPYQSDINIDRMEYCVGPILSTTQDILQPLRYIAIASAAEPKATYALSGGVAGGGCIIKAILAGASAVEVCSALYRDECSAAEWIAEALAKIETWCDSKGYGTIGEFCGAMNNSSDEHRDSVMRAQFLKHFGTYK